MVDMIAKSGRTNVLLIVFTVAVWVLAYSFPNIAGKSMSQTKKQFRVVGTCECGKHDVLSGRIVGGEETLPNEYPWIVAIFSGRKLHCGGSLINDKYILTAGHCLKWTKKESLQVVLGLHDKLTAERGGKTEGFIPEVDSVIVHEDFASDFLHDTDDIALIKLKKPVKFSSTISPICLPKNDSEFVKATSKVIGWGKTAEEGKSSRFLREANVTVLSNAECRSIPAVKDHILDSMLCAYEHGNDACQGDSGGPLVHESSLGNMEQIGVVSWGIGCAQPDLPGIYSRITHYVDWIALHTLDAIYCSVPG